MFIYLPRSRAVLCEQHVHVRYQTCTDAIITPNLITLSAISDRARQKSLVSTMILETDKTACSLINTFPPNYFNLPSVTKSRSWVSKYVLATKENWLSKRIPVNLISAAICTRFFAKLPSFSREGL